LKYKICELEKIEIINLGLDLGPFNENKTDNRNKTRSAFGLNDSEIAIAIVGRLAPIKNHDLFLKCASVIHEKTSKKVVYFIVGGGEEFTSIEEKVNALKAKGIDIRMTSWIKDINTFNAGMDILCLTSKNEGTPVSLIEAQAAGIPFVATKVGGIKDIVSENNTGYLVDLNDSDAFIEKLLHLIENENKRQEMSQKGWSFVQEKFQYKTLIAKTDSYYKFLLNQKNL
jgi:glycosyltransferase involved in cell wall biosynthesis